MVVVAACSGSDPSSEATPDSVASVAVPDSGPAGAEPIDESTSPRPSTTTVDIAPATSLAAIIPEEPADDGCPAPIPNETSQPAGIVASFDPTALEVAEGLAVDPSGNVYVSLPALGQVVRLAPGSGEHEVFAQIPDWDLAPEAYFVEHFGILGLAFDADGHLYAAVDSPGRAGVWKFDCRTGEGTRFAGTDGMLFANAMAFDDAGNLYVTESFSGMDGDVPLGAIWRITPDGTSEKWLENTELGGPNRFGLAKPNGANGIAYRAGLLYVNILQQTSIIRIPVLEDGSPGDIVPYAITDAAFINDGIALDESGRVYVTDVITNGVVRVDPDGSIVPIAGGADAGFDGPASIAFGVGATASTMYAANLAGGSVEAGATPGPGLVAIDVGTAGMTLPAEAALRPVAVDVDYGADAASDAADTPLLDVFAIDGIEQAPVIVVLHGVPQGRSITTQLSAELAARGNVVFNTDWQFNQSSNSSGSNFQAACAVRFARQNAEQYGGDPDDVVVVGYSAGGVVAATVSLNGDSISGQCSNDETLAATPDGFIGLAGTYDVYGAEPPPGSEDEAARWQTFNPFEQLESADGLDALLIHGRADRIVPIATSDDFSAALESNGAAVTTEYLDGADHFIVFDPWLREVGDVVEQWLGAR